MNEFLVAYLDAIDQRLLDYLDENEELRIDIVQRLRHYTTLLLDGVITPAALAEDWPDFFDLAPAFVAGYAPEELEILELGATFLEIGTAALLTEEDRAYLRALERQLDMYPDMGDAAEE